MPIPVRAAARAALGFSAGLALLAACATQTHRVVRPVAWREPQVDILHYDIELELDHEAGFVRGVVDVHYRGLPDTVAESLVLDAVDLDVSGAWDADDRPLEIALADDTVTVRFPRPVLPELEGVVRLRWTAYPRRGLVFVPPSGRAPGRPWHVWSQGQAEDTRHWMPVWDIPNEMATHELTVTLDASLQSVGAGTLVESTTYPRTGRRTETWRADEPHVSYLVTYAAGGFARGELGGADVPLPVLADPPDLPLAMENARHTAAMLDVLGDFTGLPYPYPKYAQTFVHDFTAGGMENISATTLYYEGVHLAADEPQIDITDLLTHELAHQWFGDLICGRGWKEIWINEGFATYCEGEFRAHLEGPAARDVLARGWQRTAMDAERVASHPIVWDGYDDPDEVFDGHVYEGAAARLHLLRDQLGDDAFLAGVRAFVARHRGQVAVTADLRRAMEEASGVDLTRFFDEWFHGRGYPSVTGEPTPDGRALVVTQQAAREGWPAVFHAELEVSWSRDGVEARTRFPLDGPAVTVPLPGDGPLDWVRLDSRGVLPGLVRTTQPDEAWVRQLGAADPMTRLVAAETLDARTNTVLCPTWPEDAFTEETRAALRRTAREDAFPHVRVLALSALHGATEEACRVLFIDLAVDPDPRVRAAAVGALSVRPDDDGLAVLRSAADDPSGAVALQAMHGLVNNDDPGAWRTLRRRFDESGPYQLRLQRDLVDLATRRAHPERVPFLVGVARRHPQRWVRAAAVTALADVPDPPGDRVFRQLCESLHDESYQVRIAAAQGLSRRGDERAARHLRARLDLEGTAFVVVELEDALAAF